MLATSFPSRREAEPQAVRAQLADILASTAFVRARRMQRFLEFIVEETLAGRSEQLGEYAIGLAVFDRKPDFEPALDPIVRNDARRLRLKLAEYYREREYRPEGVLIEIPKGGYVPLFLPPAVSAAHGCRVAVLPFEVIATAPDAAAYARALGMSLTAALTNIDGVQAIAHDYATVREIRSAFGLSHVVSGCLWRAAGCFRVILNLIQVSSGTQLWAKECNFGAGELTTIAHQVSGEISARLKPAGPLQHAAAA